MHHQIRIFIYGFIIILTMMIGLAFIAYLFGHDADSSANRAVSVQLEKINLTHELSAAINGRTLFSQSMLLETDHRVLTQDWQHYAEFDQVYAKVGERINRLITPREAQSLTGIDRLNKEISELNQQLVVLFNTGSQHKSKQLLLDEILSKTDMQLKQLEELAMTQREGVQQALERADEIARENRMRFVFYAAFSILVSLIVAVLAVIYGQRLSRQLEDLTDYLEDKVQERTESLLDTQKELLENNDELARLASTDSLTGLFNRNQINDILTNEYSRYKRHKQLFGIIMLDIDHFKPVNDNHGHDVGDLILMQLASQLEKVVRNSDHVARWGGEEFLICCTTIKPGDIFAIAENIREVIDNTDFKVVHNITVSLGCAIIHSHETVDALIKRADIALYEAKNNGRNQSVVSAMDA
jgi:diguanylate cyclase (GGDEF)-like protein